MLSVSAVFQYLNQTKCSNDPTDVYREIVIAESFSWNPRSEELRVGVGIGREFTAGELLTMTESSDETARNYYAKVNPLPFL